jgi:hypothetical protein
MGHPWRSPIPTFRKERETWGTRSLASHPNVAENAKDGAPLALAYSHVPQRTRNMGHPIFSFPTLTSQRALR